MRPRLVLPILAFAAMAHAQFYEPKTTSEDPVQRLYPVEAARVLAWLHNLDGAKIAEVTYEVKTTGADSTTWQIAWKDAAGKEIRSRTITAAQFGEGPAFYREVLHQLAGEDWVIKSVPPDNAPSAYWQGAELAGLSRAEALAAAGKILADKPRLERAADAARMAGILAHAALPELAERRSLDSLSLARAAAWLSVAAARLHEPLDAAWGPILFLAGREPAAATLWQAPTTTVKLKTNAERFWNLALRDPAAADAFTFAARKDNRPFALPAMLLFARSDARFFAPLAAVAKDTLGVETRARSYDYATALPGEQQAATAAANSARRAWLHTLAEWKPTPLDFTAWQPALPTGELPDPAVQPALDKLAAAAATPKAPRPLIPVAYATAWDALETMREAGLLPGGTPPVIAKTNPPNPVTKTNPTVPANPPTPDTPKPTSPSPLSDADIAQLATTALAAAQQPEPKPVADANPDMPADPLKGPAPAPVPAEIPHFTTADDAIAFIDKLRKPIAFPSSPEDAVRRMRALLQQRHAAAEVFAKEFKRDHRRWDVLLFGQQADLELARLEERIPADADERRQKIQEVIDAEDASDEAKGDAEYLLIMFSQFSVMEPHTLPPFQRRITAFLEKYPQHPHAREIAGLQVQLLDIPGATGEEQILAKLAALPNPAVSAWAKTIQVQRAKFAQLRKTPVELKFTATDGRPVDLAALRGQVLLLYFWSSARGPAMAEIPALVKTYDRLHDRGLAIVGISLDENLAALDDTLKKSAIPWPQHFDGAGWKNAIAQQFGIHAIPAAWLFDKKGLLRETQLHGPDLTAAIERLLAE